MEFEINIALIQTQLIIRKGATQILYESEPVHPAIADCVTETIHEFHESNEPSMVVTNPPEVRLQIFPLTQIDIQGPKTVYAAVWEHDGQKIPPMVDGDEFAPRF